MKFLDIRDENLNIIYYRTVVTDVHVWPWEPMPEVKPANLQGLIQYLRSDCNIDAEPLEADNGFASFNSTPGYMIRYGLRKQFWLPTVPTAAEFAMMEEYNAVPTVGVPCPICDKPMNFTTRMQAGSMEQEHCVYCDDCDIMISGYRKFAWTPKQIAQQVTRKK